MKKILMIILTLMSMNVDAEWSFVKSIGVGRADVDIVDFQPLGNNLVLQTVRTVTFTTLNLSFTGVRDKLYITANTDLPFSSEFYNFSDQGGDVIRSIKREDYSLTAGYNLYKRINVFGGYSYGSNDYLNESFSSPGTINSVKETDSGFFLGSNYTHDFDRYGAITATIAYALFDGEIKSNIPSSDIYNNTGDTDGFSFTITYSNKYDKESNYFLSARIRNYEYSNVTSNSAPVNIVKEKNFFMLTGGLNIF